jgi:hypothetical protein
VDIELVKIDITPYYIMYQTNTFSSTVSHFVFD